MPGTKKRSLLDSYTKIPPRKHQSNDPGSYPPKPMLDYLQLAEATRNHSRIYHRGRSRSAKSHPSSSCRRSQRTPSGQPSSVRCCRPQRSRRHWRPSARQLAQMVDRSQVLCVRVQSRQASTFLSSVVPSTGCSAKIPLRAWKAANSSESPSIMPTSSRLCCWESASFSRRNLICSASPAVVTSASCRQYIEYEADDSWND